MKTCQILEVWNILCSVQVGVMRRPEDLRVTRVSLATVLAHGGVFTLIINN